jgi:hypothetical protein
MVGSHYARMCVLKSFLHAWTTSHRAHEHILLTCIFGCAHAPDAMRHYFCWERFWSPSLQATGSVHPVSSPLLLGLDQGSPHYFLNLAIAFHYYHACRGQPMILLPSLLDASVRAIHVAFSVVPRLEATTVVPLPVATPILVPRFGASRFSPIVSDSC